MVEQELEIENKYIASVFGQGGYRTFDTSALSS
jgi:hypothetical protein